MNSLVLSGGSIKGAFQAGALGHLLRQGFVPELVYGISVGALNGAFLTDRSGRAAGAAGAAVNWPGIADGLERFWIERVTRPRDLIRERSQLSLAWALAWKRFDGIVSTEPLHAMIRREVTRENFARSPLAFHVGAVNMVTGDIAYVGKDSPRIVDYIVASTAIPISMPLVTVDQQPYYDGGIRDIAPLGRAIDSGGSRIAAIITQPERMEPRTFHRGSILQLISRVMDIVTNETVLNDLKVIERVNAMIEAEGPDSAVARRYRPIAALAIWPDRTIDVSIESFTSADIRMMLELGKESARKALAKHPDWLAGH
jgi:NTE family protein